MKSSRRLIGLSSILALTVFAIALPGIAAAKDRNHDKIPDRWEKRHHLSLKHKQTRRDQDRDGLRNRGEYKAGMDPHDADSDNDGVKDGDEGAGTITAYNADTGRLTINLFNGDSVTGTVNARTEIKCDNGDDQGDEDGDHNDGQHGQHGDQGDDDQGDDDKRSGGGNQMDGDGNHQGDDGDDGYEGDDDQHSCSRDHLTVGAIVQEAELHLGANGLVFEEIELKV